MKSAPPGENEADRLAALYRYRILDTPDEPEFDEITELAAEICGLPMALLSLVDASRRWFKRRVGLDVEQTGRGVSFCAIRQRPGLYSPPAAGAGFYLGLPPARAKQRAAGAVA